VDDDEFEFEFFPAESVESEGDSEETVEPDFLPDTPRVQRRARVTSAEIRQRRVTAVAVVGAVILLAVLVIVLTSGSSGSGGADYRGYLIGITPVASDSQQTGEALASTLGGIGASASADRAVSRIDPLVSQTADQVTRLERLAAPSTLASQQAQALAALDLRLRGLRGLRDSLVQARASQAAAGAWSAVASAQVDDLISSDQIWDSARNSADAILSARGINGFFPASKFVSDPTALLRWTRNLAARTGVPTTGRTISLGSTGTDVAAWQTALNRWLKLTAPTQTPLTVDGTFGTGTQIATQQLQTAQGLPPDGVVGAGTRRALQRALATSAASPSPTSPAAASLTSGATGPAVVSWQNLLNQWLKLKAPTQTPVTVDGNFGTETQTVTQQLQSAAGLTPTGVVDAATRRALANALRAGKSG
jgi:peptidoglycan hydrolase-like protein with peptidoglycan-binding domain